MEAGQHEGICLAPASLTLGTKTQMTRWQRWPALSPRCGRCPNITGGLLLQARPGEGGAPSSSCPWTAPCHHQHRPAGRNHHPGGSHGIEGSAAQGVRSNLRHKTKNTSEMKCLRWEEHRNSRRTHPSGLYLSPAWLCIAPMYCVGIKEERMLMFVKCPTMCCLLCRHRLAFSSLVTPSGIHLFSHSAEVETEAQKDNSA